MTYIYKCPICGENEHISQTEQNKGRNGTLEVLGKFTGKVAGTVIGYGVDAFFGTNFAQGLGSKGGAYLGKIVANDNINRKYKYHCDKCRADWTSDDFNRITLVKQYYQKMYSQKAKFVPSEPKKESIYNDNNKIYYWLPLYLILVLAVYNLFAWTVYLLTFTFWDITIGFWECCKWIIYGTIPYIAVVCIGMYIKVTSKYNEAHGIWEVEYPKAIDFNKNLKNDIDQKRDQLLSDIYANITGTISKFYIEHNVQDSNGNYGMNLHIGFTVNNMLNIPGDVVAYYHYANGAPIKDNDKKYCTTDGNVSASESFYATYDSTLYDDFVIFMPYSQLHLNQNSECTVYVIIWVADKCITTSNKVSFNYNVN